MLKLSRLTRTPGSWSSVTLAALSAAGALSGVPSSPGVNVTVSSASSTRSTVVSRRTVHDASCAHASISRTFVSPSSV